MQLYTVGMLIAQQYRITRLLGSGGMSAVYSASDIKNDTSVALKQNGLPRQRAAWVKAARQLGNLSHPNLPQIEAVLDTGDTPFLVMEYLAGQDFEELLHTGAAPATTDVLGWADQLLDALAYLHKQRPAVLHGAIRPRNLKLSGRGRPVLLDYALLPAPALATDMRRSDPYLAPEVIMGSRVDARSDLYALAATLYHLLMGIPPIDAATRRALASQGAPDPLQPPHQASAEVPVPVGVVLQAGLALDPRLRPQTATHFQALLRHAQDGHAPSLPIEAHVRKWPWQRWRGGSSLAAPASPAD
jgi:eukaryotic-like serine/threonine-protein kinase